MTQNEFEDIASLMREKALLRVRGMGVGNDTAEDIAQDVMLKLWAIHNSLPSEGNMVALAVTTARNMAIDYMRSNRKAIPIDMEKGASSLASEDTFLDRKEIEQWLESKLAKLPPTEHIVLKMRQVEGRSNSEIAVLLGLSPDSVKTLLSRARKKMLEMVKSERLKLKN